MNYQFPLMNLVTRGHLKVRNPIGTKKFIEQLDNDSCKTILENLLFVNDSSVCTRMLEDIQESYELRTNTRHFVSEKTLNEQRDKVLLKEGDEYPPIQDIGKDISEDVRSFLKYLKYAGVAGAAFALLKYPPAKRTELMNNLKEYHSKTYNMLTASPILKRILPEEAGFSGRLASTLWTWDKSHLRPSDKLYLNKVGHGIANAALIAAGITTAIIGINIAYKEFFSQEAKACKGVTGKKRTICMCNAIIAAAEKAKAKSEDALLKCDSAKDPQDCRYKLKCEIRSWMKKIEEQKKKLARLQMVNNAAYNKKPENTSPINVSPAYDPFSEPEATQQKQKPTTKPKQDIPSDPTKTGNPFENNTFPEEDQDKPNNPFA